MAQASGETGEPRGLLRVLTGARQSPLELMVGHADYTDALVRESVAWGCVVTAGGIGAFILAFHSPGFHQLGASLVVGSALVVMAAIALFGRRGNDNRFFLTVVALVAGPLAAGVLWAAGPGLDVSAALLPAYCGAVFLFFSRRTATAAMLLVLLTYAGVMAFTPGYSHPVARFSLVAGAIVATGLIVSRLLRFIEGMAVRERELHAEVASARAQLEARVAEQVEEIDRLGKLRRFLTPQVAESVLSGDAETLLGTHRKRIAVFFCDLRGFTRFSSTAEPEDIAEVLTEYYEILGRAIDAHRATVGGFGGDGVFAFFNDPFPIDDPAGAAFTMALSLRDPLRAAQRAWDARGFSLGYGLSIAYGYATMSTIGFESRSEYTAVGSVVNLGARLCDAAAPGELLVDARAYNELKPETAGVATTLMLKGFNDPVTAYRVKL